MAEEPLWKSIAQTLHQEIAGGLYRSGDKIPSEAELSGRFGVNRHTVRRALASLSEAGLTRARRGAGVFVTAPEAALPLGRKVRFSQTVRDLGRTPGRSILHSETRRASEDEAQALALAPGAPVHVVESISRIDGVPVALATSRFPAEPLPGFLKRLAETLSITAALAALGLDNYQRKSTRITSVTARPHESRHLLLPRHAPLLRTVTLNITADGQPLEFGDTRFAGERMALTVAPEGF